ncbi:hypothetical protein KKI93_19350 [Xenorhabdus bovienii]|uniref:hypothetical protein n=1 Tax=Xenorhabdus bovienii TaxID=40576 RepID=UPI0023B29A28|nr:hypothetical protein [Xenorhabdus bovienii]MDE9544965.1 hypothetical protein [Xenorhabdus bovienii]MDE9566140.1 hypothetical protein [Xenorhabdus bovienii]
MSIEIIKDQISQFLSSDKPEVMAIKGEWGIGKTFSWKKFLAEAKSENKITLGHYSYISLFGINSLEILKYAIFENVVERDLIGTEANIDTFKNNATSLTKSLGKRSIGLLKDAPIAKFFVPAIERISFLSLNKTIICIDDLERKGKNLDIKDVFGLISLLKEQKECKIILLLNDEEKNLDDYIKYREKVIDIEISFSPNPEECADIAYSNGASYHPKLKELTTRLKIRNIRVLQKIERLAELSLPFLKNCESEVIDRILHSIVLYSWSYLCSSYNNDIPKLDFIINKTSSILFINDKNFNEQEKKWIDILRKYEYNLTDELDYGIVNAVKTGFFVESELKEKINLVNQNYISSKCEKKLFDSWSLYHDSFDDNANEVINSLYSSFKENYKVFLPSNLNSIVNLFRDLDENEKASELIDFYIENRKNEIELFNLSKINTFNDIQDQELIKKFNDIYNQLVKIENAKQVLERIANSNGWNPSDEVILANTSVEDYYNLFKTEKGENLSLYVNKCLKFGKFLGASEQQQEIASRATEALKKIAAESKINRRRVEKFIIIE